MKAPAPGRYRAVLAVIAEAERDRTTDDCGFARYCAAMDLIEAIQDPATRAAIEFVLKRQRDEIVECNRALHETERQRAEFETVVAGGDFGDSVRCQILVRLRRENTELRARIARRDATVLENLALRARVTDLERENTRLRRMVEALLKKGTK